MLDILKVQVNLEHYIIIDFVLFFKQKELVNLTHWPYLINVVSYSKEIKIRVID